MRYQKLGYRLSIIILPIVSAIFVITLLYNSFLSRQLVKQAMDDRVRYQAEAINNRIYSLLFPLERMARKEALNAPTFIDDYDSLKIYLKAELEDYPEAHGASFTFISKRKQIEVGAFRDKDENIQVFQHKDKLKRPFMKMANPKDPLGHYSSYWSEPYHDEEDPKSIISSFEVPIYNKNEFIGVAKIDLSMVDLTHYISTLKVLNKGYAFLLSKEGRYLAHPDTSFIMKETIFSQANSTRRQCLNDAGLKMVDGQTGSELLYGVKGGNGPEYLYFEPLQENVGWSLGLIYPERELLAKIRALNLRLLVVGVIGIFLLVLSIVWISKRITNRLSILVEAANNIGDGDFNTLIPQDKVRDEIGVLSATFNRTQIKLGDYYEKLKTTTEAKEKIESELRIAYEIQQGIIPQIFPPFPDRSELDLFATLIPAKEVGGDLYDFFFIEDHKLCFAVGDVSGKGVPASLFMAITRTLLRANAFSCDDITSLVRRINKGLCYDNHNEMFVTFYIGILDLKTGKLTCCNAGHNYPYILNVKGELKSIEHTDGIPIGIFPDHDYTSQSIELNKGDTLILYTDGITDAMNSKQEFYGDARLKNLLASLNPIDSASDITHRILLDNKEFVKEEPQNDDITLLVIRFNGD